MKSITEIISTLTRPIFVREDIQSFKEIYRSDKMDLRRNYANFYRGIFIFILVSSAIVLLVIYSNWLVDVINFPSLLVPLIIGLLIPITIVFLVLSLKSLSRIIVLRRKISLYINSNRE